MLSITLLFCLLFRRIPDVTPSWRHCIAGAVFSSSGWIVLSVLFSVYFTAFANFDTHAELATPIPILLLWLKLCMDFLFMGAVVTAELTADTYHPLQYIKKALKR